MFNPLDTESKDKDTTPPDPMAAMFFFFAVTSIYGIITVFSTDTTQRLIFKVCYILFVICGEFFINLSLTESMCGTRQWKNTLVMTIIPWLLIFGVLHLFLTVFPGWMSPFSNTFGYLVARLMGLPDLMKELLTVDITESAAVRALESVKSDSSVLINELYTEAITPVFKQDDKGVDIPDIEPTTGKQKMERKNFDMAVKKLIDGKIFKAGINDAQKDRLYGFVQMKYTVSEYVWNLLTGFLVTSISYNYIINTGCAKSPLEMKKRYDAYEASEDKKTNDKKVADANKPDYKQT